MNIPRFLIIVMTAFILVMTSVLAQSTDNLFIFNSNPQNVTISIYVLNLGKFDISTGSFTADFYMSMRCERSCNSSSFEFVNGRAAFIDKIIDTDKEKFYRIQANLNSPVNLRQFPFDKQSMDIIIEDKIATTDSIVYISNDNESGIDESIVFTGWNIDGWETDVKEHYYKPYGETYSQYIFRINISRIRFNSFLKTFLPVFFIMLVTLFSYIIDPDKITNRLGIAGSSLVASVMFHVAITNQIPPVGYLTFADKFMILTYFVLLATFMINIAMLEFQELKKEKIVKKIHEKTEYSMLIIVPLLYVLLFLFLI